MTGIGLRARIALAVVLAAAAAALLIAGLLAITGPSDADSASASHRTLAGREAQALLQRLALPSGATVVPAHRADPAVAVASADLGRALAPDVAQRTRTWSVPQGAARVHARLSRHPPAGTRADGHLTFAVVRPPAGIAAERLQVTLVRAGPRRTVVHAVARVRWVLARPASERVPATARVLDITRGVPGRRPGIVLRVTAPGRVARIRQLIDALPTVQPGVIHCPLEVPGLARVTFTFRARPGGPALASADEDADVLAASTACDPLRFTVAGRARTPLLGGAGLLRQLSALLDRRLWLPPYAA